MHQYHLFFLTLYSDEMRKYRFYKVLNIGEDFREYYYDYHLIAVLEYDFNYVVWFK